MEGTKMKNIVEEMLTLTDTDIHVTPNGAKFKEFRTYTVGSKRKIVVSETTINGHYNVRVMASVYDPYDYVAYNGEHEWEAHEEWRLVFMASSGNEQDRELLMAQAYGVLMCLQY